MSKISIAVVGFGYWGPNLVRNIFSHPKAELACIIDSNPGALDKAAQLYSQVPICPALEDALKSVKFDAAVIATPPKTHATIANLLLDNKKHLLVEKPLVKDARELQKLKEKANASNLKIMVDHTFVYHPAVEFIRSYVNRGRLGDLLYYDSVRTNLGGFQPETNVLWDLAPHDLSILDYLSEGMLPTSLSAVGAKHFGSQVENMCYLSMQYENQFIAHLHLNWASPIKLRQIIIGGSEKMIIYDDNQPTEKIKVYDKSVSMEHNKTDDFRVNYRMGDMVAPAISSKEALNNVVDNFIHSILENKEPIANCEMALRVTRILESATKSLENKGAIVHL